MSTTPPSRGSNRPDTPLASSPEALRRMQRQKRAGTAPEVAIRRLLHARGLRYRVDRPLDLEGLRRRADLTFVGARVVVFVDGCFWHGCPQHATRPTSNAEWWSDKLAANMSRDRDTDTRLYAAGWTVIRVWEHEDPNSAAARIEAVVRGCRTNAKHPPSQ